MAEAKITETKVKPTDAEKVAREKEELTKQLAEADKFLGKELEIPIQGVPFKFHPVTVTKFSAFVECSYILGIEKLIDVFRLKSEDFDGEERLNKLLSICLNGDPKPLLDIMLAADWKVLRKMIQKQNDLDIDKDFKKRGNAEAE